MVILSDCENMNDEDLVSLTLKDSDWFFCLASRYEEKLTRYIKRISGMQKEEAEDVLQDILVKTYQNLNSFDTQLKFSSWIYRIAHNETVSAMRKRTIRQTIFLGDEDMNKFADTFDLVKEVEVSFDREIINAILSKMDYKYREVMTLRFLEEKDYLEIADILKKPVSTIGNLIARGKKIFKVEYELMNKSK
jgi:RNA polymerase sigma-70 factor (ECF subfamily)